MRVKIISNGTFLGTKVVNADTNEPIENVVVIDWSLDAKNRKPVCHLTLIDVEADLTALVQFVTHGERGEA